MKPKYVSQSGKDALQIVSFHGTEVPIGFIAFHRKERHLDCMSGHGFVTTTFPGAKKSTKAPCVCAVARAERKLKEIGKEAFEREGAEWLAKAQASIAVMVHEERVAKISPRTDLDGNIHLRNMNEEGDSVVQVPPEGSEDE